MRVTTRIPPRIPGRSTTVSAHIRLRRRLECTTRIYNLCAPAVLSRVKSLECVPRHYWRSAQRRYRCVAAVIYRCVIYRMYRRRCTRSARRLRS